jgi:integrase
MKAGGKCSSALRAAYRSFDDLCFRQGNLERHASRQKVISKATQKARRQCVHKALRDLHDLGFLIEDIHHLKQKHIRTLAQSWEGRGLGASQIQKVCSVLRIVCGWMGKRDVVPPYAEMFSHERSYRRTYVASVDKSWDAQGIDPVAAFERIADSDEHVAVQFLLALAFGLRSQEAQRFHPIEGDLGDRIQVRWGAKNGRPRVVPFTDDYAGLQRAVLDLSKKFVNVRTGSTIPEGYSAAQWYAHFAYVIRKCGVSKEASGVTLHGLRHQFLNRMYEDMTGFERPLRRLHGLSRDQRQLDEQARRMVSEAAGHSRVTISSAYLGKSRPGSDLH